MKLRKVQNRDLVEGNVFFFFYDNRTAVRRLEYFDAASNRWLIRYGNVVEDIIFWSDADPTPITSESCRDNYWIEDDPCRCFPKLIWKAERCLDCILKYYP